MMLLRMYSGWSVPINISIAQQKKISGLALHLIFHRFSHARARTHTQEDVDKDEEET